MCLRWHGARVPGEAMWFSGHATAAGRRGNNLSVSQVHLPRVCAVSHTRHAAARVCIQLGDDGAAAAAKL